MHRLLRLTIGAIFALLVASHDAAACFVPPDSAVTPDEELIARTGRIALAVAKTVSPAPTPYGEWIDGTRLYRVVYRYSFNTIEVIKGEVPASFDVHIDTGAIALSRAGSPEPYSPGFAGNSAFGRQEAIDKRVDSIPDEDYDGHRSAEWEGSGALNRPVGRAVVQSSCDISAGFRPGRTYLIFLDEPYHYRSFEQIIAPDDAWLTKVRFLVSMTR